jgi:DNA repair protein RadA/Sms
MVDTVLYFEGDTHSSFRLVRAIKNRFGAVNEIGVFAMTGAVAQRQQPSAIFLSQHSEPVPGSCVLVTLEGTRPCWWKSRRSSMVAVLARRLSVGLERDRWPCCWRCCTAMQVWPVATRTCSSTPWAGCASASRRPTWR